MSDARRHISGFTLLELLVATAMTAVLAGSLSATLRMAFSARGTAHAAVDEMRRAELAVELIRTDIESTVIPRGLLAGAFLGEDAANAAGRPADAVMLHCTATGATDTDGTGDIRMVELACETDEDDGSMIFVRRVTRYLLATRVEEPPTEILCRGVRSLDLKYHDGIDWQDTWDSTDLDNNLPLAVQVTLELVAPDDEDETATGYSVSRIFRIACAVPPRQEAEAAP